jgi:hypothetical protein
MSPGLGVDELLHESSLKFRYLCSKLQCAARLAACFSDLLLSRLPLVSALSTLAEIYVHA